MARLKENWAKLDKNKNGQVIRRTGDFAIQKGQCLEPVTIVDLFPFTHKVNIVHWVSDKNCSALNGFFILHYH